MSVPIEGSSTSDRHKTFAVEAHGHYDPADGALLSQICDAADLSHGHATIALTLLDVRAPGNPGDLLTDAWLVAVGGPLPRGASQRAEVAEDACRRRPSVQPLMKQWERELR